MACSGRKGQKARKTFLSEEDILPLASEIQQKSTVPMYYKTIDIIKLKTCPSVGDTYCSFLMQIFVSLSLKRELQQEAYVLFLLVSQSRVILPSNHTLIKYEFCFQISSNIDFVSVSCSLSFKQKTCLLAIVYMSCIV